ncbi:MAG TPA: hypothetical protein DCR14_20850 [Acidimicrobiaceae bacterium]|nr:hypothetical protein [Acidimicrobiaceae bacterium]
MNGRTAAVGDTVGGGMYRFLFQPKWLAFHALCAAVIVAMINLGFWQIRRLEEKRTFNDNVRAAADAPVTTYDDLLSTTPDGAADDLQYRRVEVTGTYLPREFEVVNVSQGGQSGHDQVGALQLADGTLLLVNRGFAPGLAALPELPEGEVTVVGRIRRSQEARRGQVADDGTQQLTEIRRVDIDVLSTQFDRPVQPVYLDALQEDGAPISGLIPIAFPSLNEGPHLSYSIQWFVFSAFVAGGWVLAIRKSISDRAEAAAEAAGRPPTKRKKPLIPEQYL